MKKEKLQRVHWIYSIITGAVCITAGICLIAGCLNIYDSGIDKPYSREIVAETFAGISLPVYLCAALVLGGFLLDLFLPIAPRKEKVSKDNVHILSRLQQKANMNTCDADLHDQIRKLQTRRKMHRCILTAVISVCSILFLSYALNIHHFDKTEITTSMVKAIFVLLPCVAVSFGYAIFVSFYSTASIQKEISLYKQIPAAKGSPPPVVHNRQYQKYLQGAITVAAVTLILYGLFTGGTLDVLTKAVNICTECIGLG